MNNEEIKNRGLQVLPPDPRDFSHSVVFGSISANDLPTEDFLVAANINLKNQDINYSSDFCTAYAAAECEEDMDQVVMVPEWTFAQGKYLLSQKSDLSVISQFGLNLRDICNAACTFGFLPANLDPFKCDTIDRPSRDFLADYRNWPVDLYEQAKPFIKPSYFAVDGPHDLFDNIRAVMWAHLNERRSVIVGCLWRQSWNTALEGIIPTSYESTGGGHSFKICGQKTINGVIYLVAQMSDGVDFGDKGFCYFPREVVNREFSPYGAYTFTHMPPDSAIWHVTNGVSIYDSWFKKGWKIISKYIKI